MNSLGNAEVAAKLAELYPSQGTVAALKSIAKAAPEQERQLANAALQRIFDYQRQAVVQITTGDSTSPFYASGALITSAGHIITSDFAVTAPDDVDSPRNPRIVFADGSAKTATVVSVDKEQGLAVLQVSGSGYPKLQLAPAPVRTGDSVLAIGTRGTRDFKKTTGSLPVARSLSLQSTLSALWVAMIPAALESFTLLFRKRRLLSRTLECLYKLL